jgi:hypothetical protein
MLRIAVADYDPPDGKLKPQHLHLRYVWTGDMVYASAQLQVSAI